MVALYPCSTTLGLYRLMYRAAPEYLREQARASGRKCAIVGRISVGLAWTLAVLLVVTAGVSYRLVASHLKLIVNTPIALPVPLDVFPTSIGNWKGESLVIPATTKSYMKRHFADDFLSRQYVHSISDAWADVYIVYCSSRPAGILGHRPGVCYPANGWVHDSTQRSQFTSDRQEDIPCLIHRFHKPAPTYDEIVILNFYVLNGKITADEDDFVGPFGRRPNIARDPARYVAQIQISSVLENYVRLAASDMVDEIMNFLPDENGKVKARKYADVADGFRQ